ncbi:hypothetical protein L1987_47081 [Smallanthus sonchifolius]|uniref:Uncharacterized protein n=1 Tax=Smallanthus sonchifolius TaxID=185202 RepID=A0ACB9G3A9_9ASTR|nr:hypothetical protein L1987_47081 [Smallanthus sonchifolius]
MWIVRSWIALHETSLADLQGIFLKELEALRLLLMRFHAIEEINWVCGDHPDEQPPKFIYCVGAIIADETGSATTTFRHHENSNRERHISSTTSSEEKDQHTPKEETINYPNTSAAALSAKRQLYSSPEITPEKRGRSSYWMHK